MISRSGRDESWREYETTVAGLFQQLGLDARVQDKVAGVRAVHVVDVAVRHTSAGVDQLWIIECKNWKRLVSMDRIATLAKVVDDMGADRGFMFCEAGFQRGAYDQARLTNLTLTSISEFQEKTRQELIDLELRNLERRTRDEMERLNALWKDGKVSAGYTSSSIHTVKGIDPIETTGKLSMIQACIERVRRDRERSIDPTFRMPSPANDWKIVKVDSWKHFHELTVNVLGILSAEVSRLAEANLST